jgi:hypothetical protein
MIWIKSAAIQTSDGQVFTGINHSQCLVDMKEKKYQEGGDVYRDLLHQKISLLRGRMQFKLQ